MDEALRAIGWDAQREKQFKPYAKRGWIPGLLVQDNNILSLVWTEGEIREAKLSGRLRRELAGAVPAVGDWLAMELGLGEEPHCIQAILPRKTCLARKVAGKSLRQQVVAANVDSVLIVTDPLFDLNLRRIQRYLVLIQRSGASPVVIINKSENLSLEEKEALAKKVSEVVNESVPVHFLSALLGLGLEQLETYAAAGQCMALVGSSGVGKSSLINRLTGRADQATAEIHEASGQGRHTTTCRSMAFLLGGGRLIDNPGMRELQLWADEDSLRSSFRDFEELALECRFSGCKHRKDAGCRITQALAAGEIDLARYEQFLKLDEEIAQFKDKHRERQSADARRSKRRLRGIQRNYEDREREREESGY